MSRKPLQQEIEISAALDEFIQTRACVTNFVVYLRPDSVVSELKKRGISVSSVTVANKYKKLGIFNIDGLWRKKV